MLSFVSHYLLQLRFACIVGLTFLLLTASNNTMYASQSSLSSDSLTRLLRKPMADTQRVKTLLDLSASFWFNAPSKGIPHAMEALERAEKIGYSAGIVRANNGISICWYEMGEYEKAKIYAEVSLKANEGFRFYREAARSYNKLGDIYRVLGNSALALEYLLKGEKIFEKAGDHSGMSASLIGMGNVCFGQQQFDLAADYYLQSLKLRESSGDSTGVADCCNNLGTTYKHINRKNLTEVYFNRALHIYESEGSLSGIATIDNNLSSYYIDIDQPGKALEHGLNALKIYEKMHEKDGISMSCSNLSEALQNLKQYDQALDYLKRAMDISKELKDIEGVELGYKGLASIYALKNDYQKAYGYYIRFSDLKDSLFNTESSKQIHEMNAKYENGQKEQAIVLLNKEKELSDSRAKKKNILLYAVLAGFLLLGGLAFMIYRSRELMERTNRLLSIQKEEIARQKEIVELKNKEVTDSIHYAQKIQHAILPSPEDVQKTIGTSFVLFEPKDIVSGDFYWISEQEDFVFFTVADCTGHGVPGSFMSMLGHSLLNEIVNEKKIFEPGDILDLLRTKIILDLKQKGLSGENKDGMDMCLCRYHKKTKTLVYAAANNSLYVLRRGELVEYKADKQPVGIASGPPVQFSQHIIQLEDADLLYLFTDGYPDQFGGPKGKKFKYRQLEAMLTELSVLPIADQKTELWNRLLHWKGNLEQVDDICMLGIRI
jgi:serine phosphatase RsbU (regulator of sigma subunit)